jgi:hypothetical protein
MPIRISYMFHEKNTLSTERTGVVTINGPVDKVITLYTSRVGTARHAFDLCAVSCTSSLSLFSCGCRKFGNDCDDIVRCSMPVRQMEMPVQLRQSPHQVGSYRPGAPSSGTPHANWESLSTAAPPPPNVCDLSAQ